jgi:hypothetical protein
MNPLPRFHYKKNYTGVKRDFLGQLHRFMASLTEMSFQAKGITVLYIPTEDLGHIDKAAKDKDLIQRLEGKFGGGGERGSGREGKGGGGGREGEGDQAE